MAAAGLTHGGFYRHFRNKDQLVAEAVTAASDETVNTLWRNVSKTGLDTAIDRYLSISHRDSQTPICPFAALGSEMARSDGETKAAATLVLKKLLATLAERQPGPDPRGDAIVALCTLIGAMTLARITSDDPLSKEILDRAKSHLHR